MKNKRDPFADLLDWIEERKEEFNPAQMVAILISTGANIAFSCAPNEQQARKVIEEAVNIGRMDSIKEKE